MTGCIFLVDLDGTLTRRELLPLIAKNFNLEETIKKLTYQCIRGEIPFVEGFLRRIEILKSIPISHIQEIIESVSLNASLVSFMQNNADSSYIVTGNLDVLVKFFPYFIPKTISSINNYLESKVLKRLTPEEMLKPFAFNQAYELITA